MSHLIAVSGPRIVAFLQSSNPEPTMPAEIDFLHGFKKWARWLLLFALAVAGAIIWLTGTFR